MNTMAQYEHNEKVLTQYEHKHEPDDIPCRRDGDKQ